MAATYMEGHSLSRNTTFCSVNGLSAQAVAVKQLGAPVISFKKINKLLFI